MISHIPLILSGLGVALAVAAILSKALDDQFGIGRVIARRLAQQPPPQLAINGHFRKRRPF